MRLLGGRNILKAVERLRGWQQLAGIQYAGRIELLFQAEQMLLKRLRVELAEEFVLFHADTMLSRDRATFGDADLEDFISRQLRLLDIAGLACIEEDNRVQVSVSRMKDIADGQIMLAGDLLNKT